MYCILRGYGDTTSFAKYNDLILAVSSLFKNNKSTAALKIYDDLSTRNRIMKIKSCKEMIMRMINIGNNFPGERV